MQIVKYEDIKNLRYFFRWDEVSCYSLYVTFDSIVSITLSLKKFLRFKKNMRESRQKCAFLVGMLAYLDAREIKSLLKFVDRNRAEKKNC